MTSSGTAKARVGLLGNPSDGFGGRVLAMTVPSFKATASVHSAVDAWDFDDSELLEATIALLRNTHPELVTEPAAVSFDTNIPRQVGLGGSSAIIIAVLRALANRAGIEWDSVDLARTALLVETEQLGWAAGPQDRVVQVFEGVLDMDFAEPWQAHRYVPLDPALSLIHI